MFKFLKNLFKGSERTYLSSSEYVSLGHPDRLADLCAAIVIDDIQHKDGANSHAAIEVFITHDTVTFGGEAKTTLTIDNKYLRSVVSKAFHRAGYISEMRKYWTKEEACLPSNVSIYNKIEAQSPDIARATTDKQEESGYNDQGIAMSSSENTNNLCLGIPHLLAKLISDELHKVSRESILKPVYYPAVLGPDNKVVVTVKVKEDGFTPIEVTAVTIAVAHSSDSSEDLVKRFAKQVADRVIYDCKIPMAENVKWTINGTGRFVIHGNISDCSMTGRKLSVNNPSAGPLWSNKLLGGGSLVKPFHASDLMLNVGSRLVSNVIVKAGLSSYAVTLISCSIGATKPQSVQIIGDDYFMKHYYKICQDYFTNSFNWSISGLVSYLHILDEGFSFADCVANNFFGDPKSQPWDNNDYIAPMAERLTDYLGLE